jgi:hypothetical protein
MEPEDVHLEPARFGLARPMIDNVEVPVVDVEVPPVDVEDCAAVHHLPPLEWTEHAAGPAE